MNAKDIEGRRSRRGGTKDRVEKTTIVKLAIKLSVEGLIPSRPVRETFEASTSEAGKGTFFVSHVGTLETVDEKRRDGLIRERIIVNNKIEDNGRAIRGRRRRRR
ncbi:MAG: hypothetical protein GY721_02020 [Deltaproteobacteria bacterium]|nr:hypothetical protein [Deltaproteobacteria bacterium]